MPRMPTMRLFAVPGRVVPQGKKSGEMLVKTLAAELQFENQRYTEFKEGDVNDSFIWVGFSEGIRLH